MKASLQKFMPVILGADENAYACARLFFESCGVISTLVCSAPLAVTSHSKILKRTVISDLDMPEVFQKELPKILCRLKEKYQKLLLIPCSDYYTELCVKNAPEIKKYIENPIISKEIYTRFSDKGAFYELAKEFNIPHPETVICSPSKLLSQKLPFDFPIVIKPSNSNSSDYLRASIKDKKKVYFCQNKSELDEVIQNFLESGLDSDITVQPFISGDSDSHFTVNAYCDNDARVRLIGAAQTVIDCHDPLSIGNYIALKPIKDRELCDLCAEILEKLSYRGFANFDIKKDSQTGKYYFLELNPRQGRSSYFMHTAGADLMLEMAEDIIFKKPFRCRKYAEGVGLWSTLPLCFIQKSLPNELRRSENFDYALNFKADRSPLRALKLARRNYTVAKKNLLQF